LAVVGYAHGALGRWNVDDKEPAWPAIWFWISEAANDPVFEVEE